MLTEELQESLHDQSDRTISGVLREIKPQLQAAHKKGLSWETIAERFTAKGFPITAKQISTFLGRERRREEEKRQRIAQRRAEATAEALAPRLNPRLEERTRLSPRGGDGLTMAQRKDRDANVLQQLQEDTRLPEFPQEKKKKP